MRFYQVFKNKRVLLPVIHVEDAEQTLRNAALAFELGADGIFLIKHGMLCQELLEILFKVRRHFPEQWVGVNCLDKEPHEVIDLTQHYDIDGIWSDSAEIYEFEQTQDYASQMWYMIQSSGWNGLYFGGVAFKYQRKVEDLKRAVEIAKNYMHVITTSGEGTGIAADVEKIRRMSKAAQDFPIAIASGITPENIHYYLPYAQCFLVATDISKSFTEFDSDKLKDLLARIRAFE